MEPEMLCELPWLNMQTRGNYAELKSTAFYSYLPVYNSVISTGRPGQDPGLLKKYVISFPCSIFLKLLLFWGEVCIS